MKEFLYGVAYMDQFQSFKFHKRTMSSSSSSSSSSSTFFSSLAASAGAADSVGASTTNADGSAKKALTCAGAQKLCGC